VLPAAAAALLVATALVAGCASVGAPQRSNTLADFDQLGVQADGTRAWCGPDVRRYAAVQFDPAAVAITADPTLDSAERESLRVELGAALKSRLNAAGFRLVDGPAGADVMVLRARITAVERADPAVNAVTAVLLWAPLSHGGLTVEFEAMDAQNGQRVAAMAFHGRAGVNNLGSAFSALGHARVQAGVAAERFAAWLAAPEVNAGRR
jgi:hypothetical protein